MPNGPDIFTVAADGLAALLGTADDDPDGLAPVDESVDDSELLVDESVVAEVVVVSDADALVDVDFAALPLWLPEHDARLMAVTAASTAALIFFIVEW